MTIYSSNIGQRESTTLVAVTMIALGSFALFAGASVFSRAAAWCRSFGAGLAHGDAAAIAVAALLLGAAVSFIAVMARNALGSWRHGRSIRRAAVRRSGKLLAVIAAVGVDERRVLQVDGIVPQAYAFGIMRPRIAVTSAMVSTFTLEELKTVLRHEMHHLVEHDPLRAFVWEVLCRTFRFLPSLRDIADHLALSRELAADRAATFTYGRRALATALLKSVAPANGGFAAVASFGQLSGRIAALSGERGVILKLDAIRAAVTALAIVTTMSAAVPAHADAGPIAPGSCRAEIDRQVGALVAPFTRAFPAGPVSGIADVQSLEIGP